ncbi:DUF4340 domain-containing protein [Croceimicrobium sp.]|uniref:DUF4340 domain-containing protein n=1 Tax=Croceimicrobium sp. TaxID=2828340 RepID=UPI003BAA42A0
MKKNLLYLIVFIVLLAVAGYLLSEDKGNSSLEGPQNYAFAVKDTASITKIVLSDKTPNKSTIQRTSDGWILDNEYPVRRDAIEVLMETLYRMEMKNFVPQRMVPEVEKHLAVFGKRVEIYKGDQLAKVIYVGLQTSNDMATYMKLEDGDLPYAVHIPGFNGFLNTRFITEPHLWRARNAVRINARNIKEVEMIYPDSLEASFKIRVFSPDSIYMLSLDTKEVVSDFSGLKGKLYLAACSQLKYEGEIIPSDPIYARRDSLLASSPVFRLTITSTTGKVNKVSGYKIKAAPETIDYDDPKSFYDPDRLHGFINDNRMILLQYYGLRNVLKSKEELEQD